MSGQIEGRNPVLEALRAGRALNRLLVARGAREGSIRQVVALARERGVVVQEVDRERLDAMAQGRNHQGVIALAAAHRYHDLDDLLARAAASGEDPLLLVLDGIEDPQNLGSLLRTADAAGVHGVIIPERRAVGLTETVAKVSAGAVEYVPVARVTNIARTLDTLKERGYWVVGTHQDGRELYYEARLTGPLAVVIGSEGKGMSRLVREKCDFVVRLPMLGHVTSLNAAVAGAILVYEIRRQRSSTG
ncbi:23S rRNA (guanosine2251-2'-O)-methyltransferase [Symbiobacterium terraclitae]|uniref:23S rRNA (Guanosine2251-2'-O)-methyltransferase n=1 Tax=Symbiobacterium terraclitae TaxID=557451 RepID=A0ABS4JS72_9FIRM|nr:23S rRNA (guanosine2251-2'-O)-methyltransferase [Symbiobacterium terraclitae]